LSCVSDIKYLIIINHQSLIISHQPIGRLIQSPDIVCLCRAKYTKKCKMNRAYRERFSQPRAVIADEFMIETQEEERT